MSEGVAERRNDRDLHELASRMISCVGETLEAVAGKSVVAWLLDEVECTEVEGWVWMLTGTKAVLRGAVEQPVAGGHIRMILDVKEAIRLCGHASQVAAEVLREHMESEFLGWHLVMFREIGNAAYKSIQRLPGSTSGKDLRVKLDEVGSVRPGFDEAGILGKGSKVFYGFKIKIGDNRSTRGWLVFDRDVARELNNGQDVLVVRPRGPSEDEFEADEKIPQAPIRGKLTAFLSGRSTLAVLRECGRRVGFEIDKRAASEVPNPAEFSDETVLIEVPVQGNKQFEWVRRIKEKNADVRVVLLLHQPSRDKVVAAVATKADVVAAWPIDAPELAIRLEPMFPA